MSAPFRVRRAVPEDAPALARVHVASWQGAYKGIVPDAYLNALPSTLERRERGWRAAVEDAGRAVFVAEDAALGVFAFIGGGLFLPGQEIPGFDAEVHTLYALPEAWGRGAGRALLRALAREMRERGFASLALWVLADNPSRGFYEHLGGQTLTEKDIEIGGALLREVALGWRNLDALT